MDLKETLKLAGQIQGFPEVEVSTPVRHATSKIGKIVEIKTRGVAVLFPAMKWNTWFSWEDGVDKRSRYARELTLRHESSLITSNKEGVPVESENLAEQEVFVYNEHDKRQWHNNCRPDIANAMSEEERKRAADNFGPNWASVLSGLGDQ